MPHKPTPKNIKMRDVFDLLEAKKLSYADLGRLLGYSRDYISLLIQGKRPITSKLLCRTLKKLLETQP